jgi:HK97 family phage major capsid protein
MAIDTKELRQRRAKLIVDARKMTELGETENRNLTSEEQENYDKLFAESGELEKRYLRIEQIQKQELALDASMDPVRPDDLHVPGTEQRTAPTDSLKTTTDHRATAEYRAMYNKFLTFGKSHLMSSLERRALQADDDVGGGYLAAPQQMSSELLKAVDDLTFVRRRGRVERITGGGSLGVVSLDTDPSFFSWNSEIGTPTEDSSMAFGKRALTTQPATGLIKISETLVRKSVISIDAIIRDRFAVLFAENEETAFMTGVGANEPLGVFTANAAGITTGRDVSTGNTTGSMTFDGLIEAKYFLKPQYWGRAAWAFHRDGVKQLMKLKDGEGQYLWQQSVQVGQPDRVLGFPMEVSEFVPNTFTTGLYVGILADWSFYWILEGLPLAIKVLSELYAETNQIGYIARLELDAMPMLEEAFVRVKLG